MKTRTATIPDFNVNETIEAAAQTAGAYAGAIVTAGVGALLTGINGIFRGAVAGAQVTHQNMGSQQVEVQNTSAANRQLQVNAAPAFQPFTPDEMQQFLQWKQAQQMAGSTNGNGH